MHWSDHFDEWLERLGLPDLGDGHVWRWWFARSLAMLEQHGWFELLEGESESGDIPKAYPIEETFFALRWMAEDYCDAVDDSEYQPYWDEWLDALGIDLSQPYESAKRHPAWEEVVDTAEEEAPISDDPRDYEDEFAREEDEQRLQSLLALQSLLLVVAQKRKAIAKILSEAWGGPHRLYQSFFATTQTNPWLYENPDDFMDDDDEEEDDSGDNDPEAFESILKRWQGMAVNELANEALEVDGSFADMGVKLAGNAWVYHDCPVRVQGYPEFYAYPHFY
jgi:hypothetical protein